MIVYLDTSAAAKLLSNEEGGVAVGRYLNERIEHQDAIVSSALLETELRRAAVRWGVAQTSVTSLLDRVDIFGLPRSTFTEAGILPGISLRSLDALHVAAALRINADVIVTFDRRQIEAAEGAGLRTLSPQ